MQNDKTKEDDQLSKSLIREDKKVDNFRIWKQKQNILSDGIMPKIIYHRRAVKSALGNLFGEENEEIKKVKNSNNNQKNLKTSLSSRNLSEVSPHVKEMLKKINIQVKSIQKSTDALHEIKILNSGIKPNTDPETGSLDLKRQKNIPQNFAYINEKYNKIFNGAFMKYNPLIHLNGLKRLLIQLPSSREGIEKVKEEVDQDIKLICDRRYYKKKYENYLNRFNRNKSVDNISRNNKIKNTSINSNNSQIYNSNNSQINNNSAIIYENSTNEESSTLAVPLENKERNNKVRKFMKIGFGIINNLHKGDEKSLSNEILNKLRKKEEKAYSNPKFLAQNIEEMEKIQNYTNEISKFISKQNLGEKIDECSGDFTIQKYLNNMNSSEKKNFVKKKDYYDKQKSNINHMISDYYSWKMKKKNEKEKDYKDYNDYDKKIKYEKILFFRDIDNKKIDSLKKFDEKIQENDVKINEDEDIDY